MDQHSAVCTKNKHMDGAMQQLPAMNVRTRQNVDNFIAIVHNIELLFGHGNARGTDGTKERLWC